MFASALSEGGSTLYVGGKFTPVQENLPPRPGRATKSWNPPVTGNGAVVSPPAGRYATATFIKFH